MEPIITLHNVMMDYGETRILHDIDLSIPKGSFTVLIGPSGCGKSTLLKLVTGIEQPTRGTVTAPDAMTMVFQNGSLLPWRTVKDNVLLALETSRMTSREKDAAVMESLAMLGMDTLSESYPRDLSGGQRQRVGIARALVSNPEVLLLDEPFSALDAETTENLHAELLKLWKDKGLTVLMISHSLDEAVELADTVHVMSQGKIIDSETILLPRPRDAKSDAFSDIHRKLRILIGQK